jgi:hypothetical protein
MTYVQKQRWRVAIPIVFLALVLYLLLVPQGIVAAEGDDMLGSAEGLFKTMKQHQYREIWPLLTRQSQEVIVKECYGRIADSGANVHTLEQVKEDFAAGGSLAKAYWNGFLMTFDPAYVLDQSKWQIGKVEKERAWITILYKKSKTPAQLLMVKEQGVWKVGLVETFWTKK